MENGSIIQFFEHKTVFITGGTGFLAKILVEKILRVQPNVNKIFLLIRAEDVNSATKRLHDEIKTLKLFNVLREKWGEDFNSFILEKVIPVPGDVYYEDLRIEETLRMEMSQQIDLIVHSAAATNFDERYDVAMGINVMGPMHVLNFAKKCTNLNMFLHVSTAYLCGEREGLICERLFSMGETPKGISDLNIDAEKKLIERKLNELQAEKVTEATAKLAMKNLGLQRAAHYGWPNTYSFTKAMGEMLLGHCRGNMPLVIIRPTIITSTYKDPFPGWIEGFRTLDTFMLGYAKGKLKCFAFHPESILDMIPGDMVVNAMLVAMALNANQPSQTIYHVGSSRRNPLKCQMILEWGYRYFTKNPWIDRSGKPVKVSKLVVFNNMASYRKYVKTHYLLPLKALELLNVAPCHFCGEKYININQKIRFMLRLMELYVPYLFFKGIFDDTNTEKLQMVVRERGTKEELFYFDPKCFGWEDYFMNVHFPGSVKYLS